MRAVIQRVRKGQVVVKGELEGSCGQGCVVLLGIGKEDTVEDVNYIAEKIANLRIFEDEQGKMNLSLIDISGEVLLVSQFTLYGDCRKGRRPSYSEAATPEEANRLYQETIRALESKGLKVETGRFQAMMEVEIHNHGPVTLLLDSKRDF